MTQLFTNNASGTLSVQAEIAHTTLTLQSNEGQLFPSPTGADFFMCTLEDTSGNIEIVKCTGRATDTLTVTRAQESTTAKVFPTGSKVEIRITASLFDELIQRTGGTMTGELDMNNQVLRDPLLTDGEIRNAPIRGTDGGTSNQIFVPTAGGAPTIGGLTIYHSGNIPSYVPTTRTLIGGEGIADIGDLSTDQTIDLDITELTAMTAADLAADDDVLVYDTNATAHKRMAVQDSGTRIVALTSSRSAVLTDNQAVIYGDGTDRTLTIPDSVFHVGAEMAFFAAGAGSIILAEGASQTINSLGGYLTISPNGGGAYLVQYAADTWALIGNLQA